LLFDQFHRNNFLELYPAGHGRHLKI